MGSGVHVFSPEDGPVVGEIAAWHHTIPFPKETESLYWMLDDVYISLQPGEAAVKLREVSLVDPVNVTLQNAVAISPDERLKIRRQDHFSADFPPGRLQTVALRDFVVRQEVPIYVLIQIKVDGPGLGTSKGLRVIYERDSHVYSSLVSQEDLAICIGETACNEPPFVH